MKKNILVVRKSNLWDFFLLYIAIIPLLTYLVGYKNLNYWIDNQTYQNYFFLAKYNSYIEIIKNGVDPLFIMFMKIFSLFDDGYTGFLLVCAFITLVFKFSGLKNSTNNFIVLLILYSSYLLCLHDYVQIRIALSMAFVAFGVYSAKSKVTILICFFIATLMHVTSIFVILPYIFYARFGARWFAIVVISSLFLPMLFFSGIIKNARLETYIELAKYKEQYATANIFATQPILQILGLLYIYISPKLKDNIRSFEYLFSVLGVLFFYMFIQVPVLSFRLFEITMFFYIILLSRVFFSSKIIMIICCLYVLVGIKNMFLGESALITLGN